MKNCTCFSILLAVLLIIAGDLSAQQRKPNVLFILVDDLKPALGCYGSAVVQSPNIDALAASGTVFKNVYCQQAVCGPTRASLLTGLRPDRTKIWDLKAQLREENPGIVSLPQYLQSQGYETIGMGKVFDPSNTDKEGDKLSWSVPFLKSFPLAKGFEDIAFGIYQSASVRAKVKANGDEGKDESQFYGPGKDPLIRFSTENLDVPDNAYMDGAMALYVVDELKKRQYNKQPFFMAVGFKKPHLPFVAPKKYWDLYNRNDIQLAAFRQKATGSPDIAYHNGGELRNYAADIVPLNDKGNMLLLSEEKQKELIHGYYACISYTDAQVGLLMQALKETGLDKNTIVVLLGDHGWHLGDHSQWCKHSNFEQAVNVPLIVRVPGITTGKTYNGITEFVDVFPSLCELTGVKTPLHIDGKSFLPALKNNSINGKEFAVSQYPRGAGDGPKEIMGYSIRTKQYRLTEWVKGFTTNKIFKEDNVVSCELYDYVNDPLETKNLVLEPSMIQIAEQLKSALHGFYQQQYSTQQTN